MLETERLRLRPVGAGDARRVAQLAGDWSIASMTARVPFPYTERDAAEWIAELGPGELVAAIIRRGDDAAELIGLVGYTTTPGGRSAELGYWIGRSYWGAGFATEAAAAVIRHCFERERFDALTCCRFADNPASGRVIDKLGFVLAGECSAWCEARRREAPALRYEMSRPAPRHWSVATLAGWRG
ncbi:MAG: GNAT family N-acetyltransferase [Hyphomicrobiaceae bacterium]